MQDKALSLLGLAKKAGMLAIGSESSAIAARRAQGSRSNTKGAAQLIITASDASDGTKRRAQANAKEADIECLAVAYTRFELGKITGRGSPGVIAILDKGFANKFKEYPTGTGKVKEGDA